MTDPIYEEKIYTLALMEFSFIQGLIAAGYRLPEQSDGELATALYSDIWSRVFVAYCGSRGINAHNVPFVEYKQLWSDVSVRHDKLVLDLLDNMEDSS